MKFTKSWLAAAAMVAVTGAAQAALVSNPDGTVTDTTNNLIWLQNWDVNSVQNWATQKAWAESRLDGFAGSNDWRLPSITEYVNLFAEFGDLRRVSAFTNVQPAFYWSGTESTPGSSAFFFVPDDGTSRFGSEDNRFFAVAVRPGDVAAPVPVPEPQTLALALLALGATVVARTRRPT